MKLYLHIMELLNNILNYIQSNRLKQDEIFANFLSFKSIYLFYRNSGF